MNIIKTLKHKKASKGISLAEVAITLVLIGIISISSISVVMLAMKVKRNSLSYIEAKRIADNSMACFRYAENADEFFEVISKSGNYTKEDNTFVLRGSSGYTVTIRTLYEQNKLEYIATDEEGKTIYQFSYNKVAGGLNNET